jgi:YD repeat-containing protein
MDSTSSRRGWFKAILGLCVSLPLVKKTCEFATQSKPAPRSLPSGLLTHVVDPVNQRTTFVYDCYGTTVRVIKPDATTFTYDAASGRSYVPDPSRITTYVYSAKDYPRPV